MNGQESFFSANRGQDNPDYEGQVVISAVDPRNQDLGHRALVPKDFDIKALFHGSKDHKVTLEPTPDRFTELR